MARAKTSKMKPSGKKLLTEHIPFASPEIKDPKLVSETLLECIRSGDLDSFREVLAVYLVSANKVFLAKKAGIARRTLYDIMDPRKRFNPELSTVSAVIRALAA